MPENELSLILLKLGLYLVGPGILLSLMSNGYFGFPNIIGFGPPSVFPIFYFPGPTRVVESISLRRTSLPIFILGEFVLYRSTGTTLYFAGPGLDSLKERVREALPITNDFCV